MQTKQPPTDDAEPTADIAAAIRDSTDTQAWEAFGHDVQKVVTQADDDADFVGVSMTVSKHLIEIRGVDPRAFNVNLCWAASSREYLEKMLADHSDALLIFRSSRADAATVDRVRDMVADELED